MFCEKCGAPIPEGETVCRKCSATSDAVTPNFGQPVNQQPIQQPMQQPMQPVFQPSSLTKNPVIFIALKIVLGCIALWAAFGPLLKYISMNFYGLISASYSFMEIKSTSDSGDIVGYFVILLILMIFAIILAVSGIILAVLPKLAPTVKLPLPSCISYAAIVFSLLCSFVGEIVTIAFIGTAEGSSASGMVHFSGFGVFMMVLSGLAVICSVCLSVLELKKK